MSGFKKEIGALFGLVVCLGIWFAPLANLPQEGKHCLALSLMAVIWWAFGVVQPGYTSLGLLVCWVLSGTAPAPVVFRLWTSPMMYLVIGGYLLAAAVESSGLGKRLAYSFALHFITSYKRMIAACYILGFVLSIMIPHPWPRSFMIMAVMTILIRSAKLEKKFAVQIGLTAFASSCPTSMILLTGDSTLNVVAMNFAGVDASWLKWILYMGVPGVVTSVLLFLIQIWFFPKPQSFDLDKEEIADLLSKMGRITRNEIVTVFWILVAVGFWMTDFLHHVHPGWVAISAALILTLPRVGNVLKPGDWSKVSLGSLFFLTAALGIGTVGGVNGMNKWIAATLLPTHVPTNVFVFALFIVVFTMVIHMVLGSVLAVMGIVTPAVLAYTAGTGISPIVVSLLVYTVVNQQYLLPFHNMAILVGEGEDAGGYTSSDVFRFGLPLTALIFVVTLCVEVPWWKMIGLIH